MITQLFFKKISGRFLGVGMVLAGGLFAVASLTACQDIRQTVDCGSVCNRYNECFDSSFDVQTCTEQCKADVEKDSDADRRLQECNLCINDRACSEAVFPCTADCVGVIDTSQG